MKVIGIPNHKNVVQHLTVEKVDLWYEDETYFHLLRAFCAERGVSGKVGSLEALGALCLLTRLDWSLSFSFLFTPAFWELRFFMPSSPPPWHLHDFHQFHIHLCHHIHYHLAKAMNRRNGRRTREIFIAPSETFWQTMKTPWSQHSDNALDWMRRTDMEETVQIICILLDN